MKKFKFLNNFDFLQNEVGLMIEGEERKRTPFGAILTLLIIVMTFVASLFFGEDIIQKRNPKSSFSKFFQEYNYLNLTNNFPIVISLVQRGAVKINNFRQYFDIAFVNFDTPMRTANQTLNSSFNYEKYNSGKCQKEDLLQYENEFRSSMNPNDLDYFFCLKQNQNLQIHGSIGQPNNSYIAILINKCQNKTRSSTLNLKKFNIPNRNLFNANISSTLANSTNQKNGLNDSTNGSDKDTRKGDSDLDLDSDKDIESTVNNNKSIYSQNNVISFDTIYSNNYDSEEIICKPQSEIERAFENVFISLYHIDFYIDVRDFEKPVKPYVRNQIIPISYLIYKRQYLYFKNIEILTDKGSIFPDGVMESKYQVDYTNSEIFFSRSVAFTPFTVAEITISLSRLKDVYNRSYYKIQNLAADVGGILKFILVVFVFVNYLVNRPLIEQDLFSTLFNYQSLENKDFAEYFRQIKLNNNCNSNNIINDALNNSKKSCNSNLEILNSFIYNNNKGKHINNNTNKNLIKKTNKFSTSVGAAGIQIANALIEPEKPEGPIINLLNHKRTCFTNNANKFFFNDLKANIDNKQLTSEEKPYLKDKIKAENANITPLFRNKSDSQTKSNNIKNFFSQNNTSTTNNKNNFKFNNIRIISPDNTINTNNYKAGKNITYMYKNNQVNNAVKSFPEKLNNNINNIGDINANYFINNSNLDSSFNHVNNPTNNANCFKENKLLEFPNGSYNYIADHSYSDNFDKLNNFIDNKDGNNKLNLLKINQPCGNKSNINNLSKSDFLNDLEMSYNLAHKSEKNIRKNTKKTKDIKDWIGDIYEIGEDINFELNQKTSQFDNGNTKELALSTMKLSDNEKIFEIQIIKDLFFIKARKYSKQQNKSFFGGSNSSLKYTSKLSFLRVLCFSLLRKREKLKIQYIRSIIAKYLDVKNYIGLINQILLFNNIFLEQNKEKFSNYIENNPVI